jgi:hypothetical protein
VAEVRAIVRGRRRKEKGRKDDAGGEKKEKQFVSTVSEYSKHGLAFQMLTFVCPFGAKTDSCKNNAKGLSKMRDFLLPLHPEGLLNCDALDQYQVEKENAPPISSLSEKQHSVLLRDLEARLGSPTRIAEQTTFDALYFFVR